MMTKLTIYVYLALVPSIICDRTELLERSKEVAKIANDGGLIKNIFQPEGNEPLGTIGGFGFVFQGMFLPSETKIAMKFTLHLYESRAKNEYEMYWYLNAVNKTDAERYGIPSVCYYGIWEEQQLIMLGMSLLELSIHHLGNQLLENDVNILIVLRDFILTSKYMHKHGVRHDDVKFGNIMVRKHRTFLIDFNASSKMTASGYAGTATFASRRAHTRGSRLPKDDWESFLYSICHFLGIEFDWYGLKNDFIIYDHKKKTDVTISKVKGINQGPLRDILVEFAEHVLDDGVGARKSFPSAYSRKRCPNYNYFYELVNDKIKESGLPSPVTFTWFTESEREKAAEDLEKNPIPKITEIEDPIRIDFDEMKYEDPDFELFTRAYENWRPPSPCLAQSSMSGNKSKKKEKTKKIGCFTFRSSKDKTK